MTVKPLKRKIPDLVSEGDVFTLSGEHYEEEEVQAIMQASSEFSLQGKILDWQRCNTVPTTENIEHLEVDTLELSDSGVDFVQYLVSSGLAKVLTFFDLHDDATYSEDFEKEIRFKNYYLL